MYFLMIINFLRFNLQFKKQHEHLILLISIQSKKRIINNELIFLSITSYSS